MTRLTRRRVLFAAASLPWVSGGCGLRSARTPLAHLYGRDWVRGVYHSYAEGYARIEARATSTSFGAYRVVARRGVSALDGLQQRGVPFFIRVSRSGDRFRVRREVPARLTFDAGMTAAERDEATRAWRRARDHIQTDYAEIRRLDWSLTRLLEQVGALRHAIDEGRREQFRVCRQVGMIDAGGALPFELPYRVSRSDYRRVLLLLLDRLDVDGRRLGAVESAIVAVGLVVRATDAGSGSLSANIRRVLLAVARDAETGRTVSVEYPEDETGRSAALARAEKLRDTIVRSDAYAGWLRARREREDVIGNLLAVIDGVTGLPTSAVYRQLVRAWQGDADYLGYLEMVARLVPGGGDLARTLRAASSATRRYRKLYTRVRSSIERADGAYRAVGDGDLSVLVNAASGFARQRAGRQLVFFRDAAEASRSARELEDTMLMSGPLPAIPAS